MEKLRVGVVGCGLIAQVMHLNYLRELSDRYEIVALCDLDANVREACARDYGVKKTFGKWQVQQPFPGIYLWQDPYGATYLIDHTGTRRLRHDDDQAA